MKLEMPVTILSENEDGDIGTELHKQITRNSLVHRIAELEDEGWAVIEVQHGESQSSFRDY